MARGGNIVPSITNAEHIGPDDTGDNIEAKRVANYVWNGSGWERQSSEAAPAPEGGATEEYQEVQTDVLNEIRSAIQAIAQAKGIAADLRVTLLGGTTAVTGTLTAVTTVTTVTTVGTVTGLTNIGGLPATQIVPATTNTTAVLSNINNVSV